MIHGSQIKDYEVWVLAPSLETTDPNLQYYYDFTQSIQEYRRAFEVLGVRWHWQPVTVNDYQQVISGLRAMAATVPLIVFNLCDGDDVNGTPGISVIHALNDAGLTYTGADARYYLLTTSKITMKQAFDDAGVSTAPWAEVDGETEPPDLLDKIGTPVLLKPAVSGGSMGLTVKNVVHNMPGLHDRMAELKAGYHGWSLDSGGILAERFIKGPEFTSLIIGSSDRPHDCLVYAPVERVFHHSLPETERFLSFDRLWEIYDDESPMPNQDNFYNYQAVDPAMSETIRALSVDAFCAVKGQGYGRLDFRKDAATGNLYVLEVNAQCGLSEDEDYTSIGAILRVSEVSFASMVRQIIEEALRHQNSIG